jgi:ankyrin repeat protein
MHVVQILQNAEILFVDAEGNTPLMIAAKSG